MKGGMTSMSFNIDKMISPFIKALPPSGLAKFLEITANNPNIVPLSVGEPDFDIPAKVRAACIDSLNAGKATIPLHWECWNCAKQ